MSAAEVTGTNTASPDAEADTLRAKALQEQDGGIPFPTPRLAWFTVAVLMVLYCLSFLDRQIPTLMVSELKAGLDLSEVQIGLLNGFAFAMTYAVFGLPFGWITDRYSRRGIIFFGVLVWSFAAFACGLAASYGELLLARFILGIGEASLAPAAYSIISDCFPKHRRAFASAVFATGSTIGSALALAIGGLIIRAIPAEGMHVPLLGDVMSWQMMFILTALPCFLLCWVIFLVPEPVRRDVALGEVRATPSQALQFIGKRPSLFSCHFTGFGLKAAGNAAVTAWMPTYMIRHYGWTAAEAGITLALMVGVGCTLGSLLIGMIADRWYQRGRQDAHLRIFMITAALQLVTLTLAMLIGEVHLFVILIAMFYATISFNGVAVSSLHIFTPNQFRGQVTAFFLMTYVLLGTGLGPLLTALATDHIFKDEMKVGWSMTLVTATLLPVSFLLLWRALAPMRDAVAQSEETREAPDASTIR